LEELGAWWGKRLARELERLEGAKAVAAAKAGEKKARAEKRSAEGQKRKLQGRARRAVAANLADHLKAGMTMERAAELENITRGTATRYLKKYPPKGGCPTLRRGRPRNPLLQEESRVIFEDGRKGYAAARIDRDGEEEPWERIDREGED